MHPFKAHHRFLALSPLFVSLASFTIFTGLLPAATINWGAATNIVGDSDVSTVGTAVSAYNLGTAGTVATLTVNTVVFTNTNAASTPVTPPPGSFSSFGIHEAKDGLNNLIHTITPRLNSNNLLYATGRGPSGSFAGSAEYAALLGSTLYAAGAMDNGGGNNSYTFQLNNLVIGNVYQLQIWFNDSRDSTNTNRRATVDGSVVVDYNVGTGSGGTSFSTAGATGQYLIGEFTADATTQEFISAGTGGTGQGGQLNGYQLRLIPEPSLTLLGGLGFTIAAARRRRI